MISNRNLKYISAPIVAGVAVLSFLMVDTIGTNQSSNVTEIFKRPAKEIRSRLEQSTFVTVIYKTPAIEEVIKTNALPAIPCKMAGRIRSITDGQCYTKKNLPENQP